MKLTQRCSKHLQVGLRGGGKLVIRLKFPPGKCRFQVWKQKEIDEFDHGDGGVVTSDHFALLQAVDADPRKY